MESNEMKSKAIQDYYPEELSYCYGCGRLNEHGHQIKSFWDGEGTIAHFTPKEYHIAIPGYVYGGLIASLIDCHGTGTAALASYLAAGREPGTQPPFRFRAGKQYGGDSWNRSADSRSHDFWSADSARRCLFTGDEQAVCGKR